jgi:hypothetical protein
LDLKVGQNKLIINQNHLFMKQLLHTGMVGFPGARGPKGNVIY